MSATGHGTAAGVRMKSNRYAKLLYVIVICPMRGCFFLAVSLEPYRLEAY